MITLGLLGPVCGFAQSSGDWLPQQGVKQPYSPLTQERIQSLCKGQGRTFVKRYMAGFKTFYFILRVL